MENNKRFEAKTLNSEDYEKTEAGAKAVKEGGAILIAAGIVFSAVKKYGPSLLKNLSKIIIR